MKKPVSLLLLLILALCNQLAIGQGTGNSGALTGSLAPKGNSRITGTVLDATNQHPVSFATITLNNPASGKALDGALADDKGKFTISNIGGGTYQLVITFIGYQTRTINDVKVSGRDEAVNLGEIKINTSTQTLKEVTIEAQRAMIEEKVDRTVYNAENDQTNRGGDATDVLRKVPMLSVDLEGNVSMRGSQNIKVLINNKPSTIAASSVADALKQIPADMIKSVEVITSPSARYDAEGSAGIINIVTKKNNLSGFSLNVDGSAGLRGSNLGLRGSYRKGKMGFSLGGFGRSMYNVKGAFNNEQTSIFTDDLGIEIQNLRKQSADTRSRNLFGRYTLGWDYDIDKNNFITASVMFGVRNGRQNQDFLRTLTYRNETFIRSILEDSESKDLSGNVDVSLNYTHTFAKPQQELNILTLFSRNNRTNDFIRDSLNEDNNAILHRLKNDNQSFNQESTIQVDYQNPIGKTQLVEFGGKIISRQVTSDYQSSEADGPNLPFVPLLNQQFANVFDYNQNISGAYTSYTLTTPKNYSLKAGARYEYTTIDARFKNGTNGERDIPSYGSLVPSVNLSKKLKSGNTVKLAYNRRIQRPSLQYLNPNVQSANPINITVGNPDLRPEFTNNFELGYNTYLKSTFLTFSTFFRNTNNSIQSVREPIRPGSDTIRTTYANIGQEDAYGFGVFGNVNLSNKLSINGGTDVYYAVLDNNLADPLLKASNTGWVASVRAMGSYNFAKDWGLQLFGFYRGRQVQLQGFQSGFGIYSLSLRRDFKGKRGSIGIGAENFITSNIKMRSESQSANFYQRSTNTMYNTSVKVNFSYRIGKMSMDDQPRRRKKSVTNDDLKEGGGDGGQDNGGGGAAGNNGGQGAAGGGQGQRSGGQTQGTGGRPGGQMPQRPGAGNGQAPAGRSGQVTPGQIVPGQAPTTAPGQSLLGNTPADSIKRAPLTQPNQPTDSVKPAAPTDSLNQAPVTQPSATPTDSLQQAPANRPTTPTMPEVNKQPARQE
ncbi:TonB-dependent receptor [Adhaeribacter arboris]|uniref:TonB-dependent receptor n=1 Tax=Adhaeribacter arboris TaxID=2072846 RepID=A0A2T2YER5_9BACT|nr:outer membrane beta-barrel family protein [Adhaeribacter arboris]PSR54006.1 TonB-dependent receptor [Adhaeribacter arboris]